MLLWNEVKNDQINEAKTFSVCIVKAPPFGEFFVEFLQTEIKNP
jgi:hypothetical protein